MSEPLSKKLGLYHKTCDLNGYSVKPVIWGDEVIGYASGDYNKGYNDCVDDLDQLSPDVEELSNIYYEEDDQESPSGVVRCYVGKDLAQKIINSMGVWIKKG